MPRLERDDLQPSPHPDRSGADRIVAFARNVSDGVLTPA
jgi:hypothetical protein